TSMRRLFGGMSDEGLTVRVASKTSGQPAPSISPSGKEPELWSAKQLRACAVASHSGAAPASPSFTPSAFRIDQIRFVAEMWLVSSWHSPYESVLLDVPNEVSNAAVHSRRPSWVIRYRSSGVENCFMSAMPRKRRLVVNASCVAMGQLQTL